MIHYCMVLMLSGLGNTTVFNAAIDAVKTFRVCHTGNFIPMKETKRVYSKKSTYLKVEKNCQYGICGAECSQAACGAIRIGCSKRK